MKNDVKFFLIQKPSRTTDCTYRNFCILAKNEEKEKYDCYTIGCSIVEVTEERILKCFTILQKMGGFQRAKDVIGVSTCNLDVKKYDMCRAIIEAGVEL